MIVIIIILSIFLIATFVQLRKAKGISKLDFGIRIVASILLLMLVWWPHSSHGTVYAKVGLSVIAVVSVYAASVQYKKGLAKI